MSVWCNRYEGGVLINRHELNNQTQLNKRNKKVLIKAQTDVKIKNVNEDNLTLALNDSKLKIP